ncbi:MAG: AMP-binding protein [Cyclobacteriaceae bacterium]|nr:AMP-binding protein [Cyclobacteriaceae bacterium]
MQVYVQGAWRNPETLGSLNQASLGESTQHAVNFIRAWNEGKSSFEFQTSGSTGTPKRMTFSRRSLENSARLTLRSLGLQPGMNALVTLDTRFVAGAMMLVRGLVGDLNLILQEPSSHPLQQLPGPVHFLALVPLQLKTLLQESRQELDQVATVIIGGAPLEDELIPWLENMHPQFYATYGMTETLTHIALRKLNGPGKQNAIYPLPGVHISLDERGCLIIEAGHLDTSRVVTNDLAILTPDGGFQILGRADEVINSGGVKVHPRAVEAATGQVLKSLSITSRFFVAGIPDPLLHEKVCLVMEGTPLPSDTEHQLLDRLRDQLNKYELPRQIIYRMKFAETATQKIDKRATLAI